MRDDVDVVGFCPVGYLSGFGDASDDTEVDAGVVDEFFFDDLSERPFGNPLFANGDRNTELAAQVA